jgi:hypothetical protein
MKNRVIACQRRVVPADAPANSEGVEAKPERSEPEGSSTGASRAAGGNECSLIWSNTVEHGGPPLHEILVCQCGSVAPLGK